jgi:F0F1-type ATP synthase assembly protein I
VQTEGSEPSCAASAGCDDAGEVPFAMSDVPVRGYRLVVRVVLLQTGCALLVASLYFAYRGASSGIAALAGGLIVAVGSAVFGWRAFAPGVAGAAVLSRAMFAGVALKWLWFVLALYLALGRLKLEAVPLLVGLATAQFGYWVGMVRLK